jgi:P-type Na+/K+ transporter
MESLKRLSSPTATVLRHTTESRVISIPTSDVTVGDVIELRSGQIVPADLRLFSTFDLQIDESLLTGESLAALKGIEVLSRDDGDDPPIGDCVNIAFAATLVTNGWGRGVVYATGMNTEVSKMAGLLGGTAKSSTTKPLPRRVRAVSLAKKFLGLYNLSPLQLK